MIRRKIFVLNLALAIIFVNVCTAGMIAPTVAEVSSENPVPGRNASHSVDGSGLTDNGKKHLQGETGIAWTTVGMYGCS